ncbi:MAG: TPM domain-containing protein, partial [Steroidobacteraceae bacterium]
MLAPVRAQGLQAVPPLEARVTDLTGTLTAGQQAELEQKLAAFEQRKGAQIALLVVPTTAPEAIEQYSIRVVDAWKLG